MKIKNNDKWERSKSALKDDMTFHILDPDTRKYTWFNVKYPVTIYETPKNYKYSLTLNDGNWLRFPTEYRTMNGKPKAIYLANDKAAVKELAFFCRFQWLLGVRLKEELVYHMMTFICDIVKLKDGVFECNQKNKDVLFKIAEYILNSEPRQQTIDRLKDNRLFCIDQRKLEMADSKERASMQAKGRRLSTYYHIHKNYDEKKSIRQNATSCGVSVSTIKRYKRSRDDFEKIAKDCGWI